MEPSLPRRRFPTLIRTHLPRGTHKLVRTEPAHGAIHVATAQLRTFRPRLNQRHSRWCRGVGAALVMMALWTGIIVGIVSVALPLNLDPEHAATVSASLRKCRTRLETRYDGFLQAHYVCQVKGMRVAVAGHDAFRFRRRSGAEMLRVACEASGLSFDQVIGSTPGAALGRAVAVNNVMFMCNLICRCLWADTLV